MDIVGSRGSMVPLGESLDMEATWSLANHWYQRVIPEAVMFTGFSGRGYFQDLIWNISNHFLRLVRFSIRTLSRAFAWKPQRLRNAMVQRITRMVITTMSSTRVKPLYFLFFVFFVCMGSVGKKIN